MGNIPNNGIINEGRRTVVKCIECQKHFETMVGAQTIKGVTPPPAFCKECQLNILDKINFDEVFLQHSQKEQPKK